MFEPVPTAAPYTLRVTVVIHKRGHQYPALSQAGTHGSANIAVMYQQVAIWNSN